MTGNSKNGQKRILEAKGMTKRFSGLVAVDNLDFYIPEGAIASIIGPNGAGKTTFFNCITGFYQIDEGEILFDGARVNGKSPGPDHALRHRANLPKHTSIQQYVGD